MNKKYLKIVLIFLAIVVIYLYLAHTSIYRRLGYAHLQATDNKHTYLVGDVAKNDQKIIYVALGDSLTAGVGTKKYEQSYPYLVAAYLAGTDRLVEHVNVSYPGARTEDIIRDLLVPAIKEQPDVITLLIGVNDIHGFVSTKQFEKNYDYILKELTTKTSAKIYVIGIPDIGSQTLILPPYNYFFANKAKAFNEVIQGLVKVYKLQYIDLATPTKEILKKNSTYYATDSFHPSAVGYASWAKIIYDGINQ